MLVNFIKLVSTENDDFILFACFCNQVTIYEIDLNQNSKILQEIIIEDFGEDIKTLDIKNSQIAFGGELGIIYLSELENPGVQKLTGHFKNINDLKYIRWGSENQNFEKLLMSASDDFSVRIWHTGLTLDQGEA